jgi:uncharacterized alkaline shock family protein YloU
MNSEESHTDLGSIRIHKNVIASIASLAAIEISGVKRIGGDFKSGVIELIGRKPHLSVKVEINKNEEVRVGVPIVIKYGFNIPDIANRVQENVRLALEKMTNLSIKDVDVMVQAIEKE